MRAAVIREPYFLPYQLNWLADHSPVKLWEKSRRIGATYTQSYEDVRDVLSGAVAAVWFSSADESAAREYIRYCRQWAEVFIKAAGDLGEQVLAPRGAANTFSIAFSNGGRITALSSNPKAFRSKGGKVVLDEFAHHADQEALWKAARPAITWGYPIRVLSTHNGASSLFAQFLTAAAAGRLPWSTHRTPLAAAVQQGLANRIAGKLLSAQEAADWVEEQRRLCGDEVTWLEEYCCVPADGAASFIPYADIAACVQEGAYSPGLFEQPPDGVYAGADIGRKQDLTVLCVLELRGEVLYTAGIHTLHNAPFERQRNALLQWCRQYGITRLCVDATGQGMQLAEELQAALGKHRAEPVTFTPKVKEEIAYALKRRFEGRRMVIPPAPELREDLASVKRMVTSAGNARFNADRGSSPGHGDRFWAMALAVHACGSTLPQVTLASGSKRRSYRALKGFR